MTWFSLAMIFTLGVASGFFGVLTLVYRRREARAREALDSAVDDRNMARSHEARRLLLCADRDRDLHKLRAEAAALRTELQAAQNSLAEQNAQLRDRDRRLAEQANYLDTFVADVRLTWEKRLDESNLRAARLAEKLDAAEREVLRAKARHSKDHDSWVENRGTLLARIDELVGLITAHRDKRGHECCHLNDGELYAAAGLEPACACLPPLTEFIPQCITYWFDKQGLPRPSNGRHLPVYMPTELSRDIAEEIIALLSQPTLDVDERIRLAGFGFGIAGKETAWCLTAVPACNFTLEVWQSGDGPDLAERLRSAIQRAAEASPYLAEVS